MNQEDTLRVWKESAERNLAIGKEMIAAGHYDWALFFGQLALEKLLKGLVTKKTDEAPPFIHDLGKLATVAQIPLTAEQTSDFAEITTFHVAARYDDIKKELYFKATADYSKLYFSKIEEYASWLIKQY